MIEWGARSPPASGCPGTMGHRRADWAYKISRWVIQAVQS